MRLLSTLQDQECGVELARGMYDVERQQVDYGIRVC